MRSFIFISTITIALWSCDRDPDYSEVPAISFQSISKFEKIDPNTLAQTDSIVIAVNFQDGDGNLGTDISDTSTPNNYTVTTFKRTNGVFNVLNLPIELGGKFPQLAPNDEIGPIDGVLNYSFLIPATAAASNPDLNVGDTLRFSVFVTDESGNNSNTVQTSAITILD